MPGHAWWRVNITTWTGAFFPGVGDIEFRTAIGGAQAAVGGAGIAISTFPGTSANNPYDANPGTVWSAAASGTPSWIGYHFAAPVSIAELLWVERSDGGGWPSDFTVDYSDDGAAWTVAGTFHDGTPYVANEARAYALPVVDTALAATLPLPWRVAGAFVGNPALHATLPLPWRVAGAFSGNRTLAAMLRWPLAALGLLHQSPEWRETDFGPDIITDPLTLVTVETGVLPIDGGLERDRQYQNVSRTIDEITMLFDWYSINSFTAAPEWHTGGKETFQFHAGTGGGSTTPASIFFDKPIRGFTVTLQQVDFNDNRIYAYDANGTLLGIRDFPPAQGQAGFPITRSFDAGSNLIRRLTFAPDVSDWVCWSDFIFTYDTVNLRPNGWQQTDLDPASSWAAADAPPVTAWS